MKLTPLRWFSLIAVVAVAALAVAIWRWEAIFLAFLCEAAFWFFVGGLVEGRDRSRE